MLILSTLFYRLFVFAADELATNFKSIKPHWRSVAQLTWTDCMSALSGPRRKAARNCSSVSRWTLADDLDGAIRQIAHIAGNPKRASASLRPPAKADALDLSVNDGAQLDT